METWKIIVIVYIVFALLAYLSYERADHHRKPPRPYIRWTLPWYYTIAIHGIGLGWFLGVWWVGKPFRQWGIRALGFEYFVEYFR